MNGFITLSDTSKKNLEITDQKKNPKRLLSIHPHHHRYCLTAHLVSLMFSTRDYTSDTGFLWVNTRVPCYKMASRNL